MKNVTTLLLVCLLALLVACADSSTVGTDLDKRYDITLNVYDNQGPVDIAIPVTVEADSESTTDQTTDDESTLSPTTDLDIPLAGM